jgi:hypothetical protein
MKKFSTSLARKEIQIKTILRFHLIPVRVATIKKTNNRVGAGERNDPSLVCTYE